MKITRTIELTVVKNETLTVRRSRKAILAWCVLCGGEVKVLTPESAAEIAGTNTGDIYQAITTGRLHFVQLPEGRSLVCLDSLLGD